MSSKLIPRYFVINKNTSVMHVHGLCQQTKPRDIPIRLFESPKQVSEYAQRDLRLCRVCRKALFDR